LFTFEIRFYPKSFEEALIDDFIDNMYEFISCLCKNAQILETSQNVVKLEDHYAYRVIAPEMDSLNEKYHNRYCSRFLAAILEKSLREPEIHFIGENYNVPDSCECKTTSHYILFYPHKTDEYPILCGDCLHSVPLYKLPKTYDDEEYYDVYCWLRVYEACDKLFMEGIGERYAYKMINDPNSKLSKEGLRLCAYWEEHTKKPFYYFLFKYYRKNKPTCPKCNKNWVNQNKTIQYDYVCEKCRLVSNDIQKYKVQLLEN